MDTQRNYFCFLCLLFRQLLEDFLVLYLKHKGSSERKCAGNRSSNFCAGKSSTRASSSWASIFGCQVFFLLFWLKVKTPIIRKQGLEEATFGNFYKTVVFFSFFLRDCFGSVQFCVGLLKSSVQGMSLGLLTSLTSTKLDQVTTLFSCSANLSFKLPSF